MIEGGVRCACGTWVVFESAQRGKLHCPSCEKFVNVTTEDPEEESMDESDHDGDKGCMSEPCGLSHQELEQACRNIGFDLTCGACAERFFTGGSWSGEHDRVCQTVNKNLLLAKLP